MSHKCAPTLPWTRSPRSSTSRRRSRETGPACFKMATVRIIGPDRWAKVRGTEKKRKRNNGYGKINSSLARIFCMLYVNLYVIMKLLQLVRIEQTRTNYVRYRNININILTIFNLYNKPVFHIMRYGKLRYDVYRWKFTWYYNGGEGWYIPCDIDTYRKI